MRRQFLALIAATASGTLLLASLPAEAQDRARTRIVVQPKSYLNPGTKVQPGSMHYHRYAFPLKRHEQQSFLPDAHCVEEQREPGEEQRRDERGGQEIASLRCRFGRTIRLACAERGAKLGEYRHTEERHE